MLSSEGEATGTKLGAAADNPHWTGLLLKLGSRLGSWNRATLAPRTAQLLCLEWGACDGTVGGASNGVDWGTSYDTTIEPGAMIGTTLGMAARGTAWSGTSAVTSLVKGLGASVGALMRLSFGAASGASKGLELADFGKSEGVVLIA
jgi:hypothetical protein